MTTKTDRVEIDMTSGDSPPRAAASERSPGSARKSSRRVSRPLTLLIGREREVAEAVALLRNPEVRLLTITGAGGIGKSRLAVQVAMEVQQDFADGSHLVELAYCTSREQVERAILHALRLRERGRELFGRLESALREQQLLLVIDNFEQALAAAPLLPDLLLACPGLKIMVTSRVVLRVQGEFELPVPPLSLPDLRELPAPEALLESGAVALFVQRVQAISREFALTEENSRDIAEICVRLDGVPLALELAAAHTKLLSPHQLLARLEKPLEVLTRGGPDLPERQQTLRATMEWSYALLTGEEQAVFRRLAVFVGGAPLEAAEVVCRALGKVSTPVIDVTASLLDHSLLLQVKQESGQVLLVLLETLREYGLERLEESGEREGTQQAHAAYYLALAEQAEPFMSQSPWLEQLGQQHDNFITALDWLLEHQAVEQALRLAGALRQFWFLRGYMNEGRGFLERAVAALREEDISVSPQVRAKALYADGSLAYWQSDFEPARRLAQESLELFRQQGDPRGAANALRLLGIIESGPGNDDTVGDAFFVESLRLFRDVGDEAGIAATLLTLGVQSFFRGEFARAQEMWEESLSIFRKLGDSWHIALTLHYLGWASSCQGAYAVARLLSEESVALFRRLGNPGGFAVQALTTLADEVAALGEETTAALLLEEALARAKQGESWEDKARALYGLGHLALRQGHLAQAQARYRESLAVLRDVWTAARLTTRTKWISASCLEGLGEIAFRQGQTTWTVRLFGAAETLRVLGAHRNPVGIEQLYYERTLEAARSQVGEAAFVALWAEGQTMVPEEVLAVQEQLFGSEEDPGYLTTSAHPSPSYGLTARELEVLRLLAGALTNKQIANLLVISPKTVNIHVASLYKKLNITSRTAATRFAIDNHLVR